MNTATRSFTTVLATACCAGSACAAISFESLQGLEGLGSFEGTAAWTHTGIGIGRLEICLTNTSPEGNGGYLTGFAFHTVSGVQLDLLEAPLFEEGVQWQGMANVVAEPWKDFSFGAALGGNWLGGGSPNHGIAVGATACFAFEVTGDDTILAGLDDESIFLSTIQPTMAARFRGFLDEGSDKVPANLPAPGALAAFAVSALLGNRRRRSS